LKRIFYILSLALLSNVKLVSSQESLTNLVVNPEILEISRVQSGKTKKTLKGPVELPFIEDFAKADGYPDSEKWINQYAYVNNSFPYNPVSVGVATLDAINEDGSMYSTASTSTFGSDTLTSQPINLNYPGNNTIFISFFYQPGGLGDAPEPEDLLYIDFYSPDSAKWNQAWQVSFNETDSVLTEQYAYNSNTKIIRADTVQLSKLFQQVIIPISEDQYLKNNFQFRFRNTASLSATGNTSLAAGNCDFWHLDFIKLDTARTINDTIIDDICFIKPLGSLLNNFESLPWTHFSRANATEMSDSIQIEYANLADTNLSIGGREFEFECILGGVGDYSFTGISTPQIEAFSVVTYKIKTNYNFNYNPDIVADSALFELRSYLITDTFSIRSQYRWNDTIHYLQKFYNYYSYDDGSSEMGYDLVGNGTESGMVAVRFKTYKEDTLRGVQIYFNQSLNNTNEKYFKLCVWNEINNKPGNILYIKENIKPVFSDSLNKFTSYLFDTALVLENNFYIGWQKVYENSLNVGFDVNKINNDKTFYNFSGIWQNSAYEGTVMIRPMFGREINLPTTSIENSLPEKFEFNLYPNPATNSINIEFNNSSYTQYQYTIFDIYGKSYIDKILSEPTIDISGLSSGIYFIRLSNVNGQFASKKFIVIR